MPRADSNTGTRPEGDAAAPPPAPTVVLLVRHGTTTTTGKELPGRAPGLHLAESGRRQADEVAARIVRVTARPPVAGTDPPGEHAGPAAAPTAHGTPSSAGDGAAPAPYDRPPPAGEPAATPASDAAPRPAPRPAGIAAVYASPLERTRETAAPIAAATGRDVSVDADLVDLDVGDWTGLALADAQKRPEWSTIQRYPSGFTFPGGESFVAMQARMVAVLARLRARHPGETVVAVSHADPIRAVVAHALGTHLDLFQRVVVSPCSLTVLSLGDGGPVVLTVNATADPDGLVPS